MDIEELEPTKQKPQPRNLDVLSIEELNDLYRGDADGDPAGRREDRREEGAYQRRRRHFQIGNHRKTGIDAQR